MNRRAEILAALARYEVPTKPLLRELAAFGWDWPGEPLLVLKKADLLRIIDRYLAGEIDAAQLQDWAENLEAREDVALESDGLEVLDDVFFRIATPFINQPLTPEVVRRMRHDLTRNS